MTSNLWKTICSVSQIFSGWKYRSHYQFLLVNDPALHYIMKLRVFEVVVWSNTTPFPNAYVSHYIFNCMKQLRLMDYRLSVDVAWLTSTVSSIIF